MFNDVAATYNANGLATLQFDYRGCGYSSGKFIEFTVSGAIDDLIAACRFARDRSGTDHLFVHGQSLGSAIAALARERIDSLSGLVLWNLSADIYNRYPRIFGRGIRTQDTYYLPEKGLATGRRFMDDARGHDVLASFDRSELPTLFLNAGEDEKSSAKYAREAHSRMERGVGEITVLPKANHSFKSQPDLQDEATEISHRWLQQRI